jgi:uncharacterized protein (TIGR00255 family)
MAGKAGMVPAIGVSLMLASMTGFARAAGRFDQQGWAWELRSVNGRGLDLRFRLPAGFEAFELPARALAIKHIKRGCVFITLAFDSRSTEPQYRINSALLQELYAMAVDAAAKVGAPKPQLDGLLTAKGVVEPVDVLSDLAGREGFEAALMQSLDDALAHLVEARRGEGAKIAASLADLLDRIAILAGEAKRLAELRPEALRLRLKEHVRLLLDVDTRVPEERLAQELAMQLLRFDVREELDRLGAHVAQARGLVTGAGFDAVGRRLDFLAQELHREANTLCAKANDAALTALGLDLKLAIDRFREQVQNIE